MPLHECKIWKPKSKEALGKQVWSEAQNRYIWLTWIKSRMVLSFKPRMLRLWRGSLFWCPVALTLTNLLTTPVSLKVRIVCGRLLRVFPRNLPESWRNNADRILNSEPRDVYLRISRCLLNGKPVLCPILSWELPCLGKEKNSREKHPK